MHGKKTFIKYNISALIFIKTTVYYIILQVGWLKSNFFFNLLKLMIH